MAERFYSDFEDYESYDTMGVTPDDLTRLYPDKDNREMLLRCVRGLFRNRRVSYEEASDILRLGESPDGNMCGGAIRSGTIYEGLEQVRLIPVEERQAARAALFAAAAAGA